MSTPVDQIPAVAEPTEIEKLQNVLKTAVAKLMAHSQTVQELIKANMDLRAALHLAQSDKGSMEAYIQSLLNPAPVTEVPATDVPAEAPADANTVPA